MKILQNRKDGSGRIIFTDQEIEILNDKGYFEIDALTLKKIGNHLVKLVGEIHEYLPEETLKVNSFDNEHIELEKKRIAWRKENKDLDAISLDIGWQEELIRISEEENSIMGDFNKAIEDNLMTSAYDNFGKENLLYDYSNENDLNIMKNMIQNYYLDVGIQSNQIKDYGYIR